MPAVTLRPLSSRKLAIWNSESGIWNSYAHPTIRLLLAGIISVHVTAASLPATAQVTGSARMLAGFDADRSALARQLDELAATGAAAGSPHEALALAASTLAATGAPFTSIVLLSAGASEDRDLDQDATAPVGPRSAILH